jgi:hypothetical protein
VITQRRAGELKMILEALEIEEIEVVSQSGRGGRNLPILPPPDPRISAVDGCGGSAGCSCTDGSPEEPFWPWDACCSGFSCDGPSL